MSILDLFALFVLFVLLAFVVVVWVVLGMLPGRIARARNHPQADAVNVCGWWGVITMGLLVPLAFIWAYYDPRWREREATANRGTDCGSAEAAS
jgi:uncharacterized BrkB/YihY/UPF0761 family membrane protein